MWKKDEVAPASINEPRPEDRGRRSESVPPTRNSAERATIGPSITIRGEVSGDEDLLIQGRVHGSVDLQQQTVTVGREGQVKANITGRVVTVEGEVEGDLMAQEQVILRASAQVQGDITAPRVVLEDGASFRGMVDMGDPGIRGTDAGKGSGPGAKKDSGLATTSQPGSGKAGTAGDTGKKASGSTGTPTDEGKDAPESAVKTVS